MNGSLYMRMIIIIHQQDFILTEQTILKCWTFFRIVSVGKYSRWSGTRRGHYRFYDLKDAKVVHILAKTYRLMIDRFYKHQILQPGYYS